MSEEQTKEQKLALGIVEIHGKDYLTVARRIHDFREKHPAYTISSKILSAAELVQVRSTIKDETGRVLATGFAEEVRGSTNINATSALENCETSAVGRCLAFFGLAGTAIASADEVAAALEQQKELALVERLKAHNGAVRENIESIVAIKAHLLNDEYGAAYEAYQEIHDDDKAAITLAPTKGGIFTTAEIAKLRSNEWTAARQEYHGIEAPE